MQLDLKTYVSNVFTFAMLTVKNNHYRISSIKFHPWLGCALFYETFKKAPPLLSAAHEADVALISHNYRKDIKITK